jgi:2-hydroxychromene-2-carboxylate isomerase
VLQVVSYTIYHSTNAYLGSILAERALAGLPVELVRRPLCIPKERGIWVADLVGGQASPRQGPYNRRDCERWAAHHGIEMRMPSLAELAQRVTRWRRSPLAREELPARAYYASLGSGREAALDAALFRASYVDGADVNDDAVLRRAIASAGLDPDALLERARGDAAKAALDAALADFDAAQCPGTPTFVFEGEQFWGKDRVDWLADAVRRRLGG